MDQATYSLIFPHIHSIQPRSSILLMNNAAWRWHQVQDGWSGLSSLLAAINFPRAPSHLNHMQPLVSEVSSVSSTVPGVRQSFARLIRPLSSSGAGAVNAISKGSPFAFIYRDEFPRPGKPSARELWWRPSARYWWMLTSVSQSTACLSSTNVLRVSKTCSQPLKIMEPTFIIPRRRSDEE